MSQERADYSRSKGLPARCTTIDAKMTLWSKEDFAELLHQERTIETGLDCTEILSSFTK